MTDVSFVEKVVKQVKRLLARDGMHPGMIIDYAGENPPEGWLWCDGSEVSRAEYPALFQAIGTKWGAGDGITTFNLPDSRKRVREGANNISEVGQKVEAGLPDISGVADGSVCFNSRSGAFSLSNEGNGLVQDPSVRGYHALNFYAHSSNALYGASDTVRMASLRALAIIKS